MSDAKKEGSESGGGDNFFANTLFWILFVLVAYRVFKYLLNLVGISFTNFPSLTSVFASIFGSVQVVSVFLSLVFLLGIIFFNFKLGQLTHHSHDHGHGHGHGHNHETHSHSAGHHNHSNTGHKVASDQSLNNTNKRWQSVLHRIESQNESDWRLAIIESDIILNDMLEKMGYRGDGVAEKLKQIEKSDFNTLDYAWSAHKLRNMIAHSGSEFHLSRREAVEAFEAYKKVFEEFYFI